MSQTSYTDEYYAQKAQKMGLRARSYFKLEEIDAKLAIFKKIPSENWIIDLGCAPGSWIQYALKHTKSNILGIDLQEIIPFSEKIGKKNEKRVTFLQKDINIISIKELDEATRGGSIGLIMSDMAPKTSGNREADSYLSFELVLTAWELTKKIINNQINTKKNLKLVFIAKYFEGAEHIELMNTIREGIKLFVDKSIIKIFKPQSSRKNSREIFIVVKFG